jgi:hypothetical protein
VVWRKFEAIETCSMKTILSFLRSVSDGLDWVRQGLVSFWRINKFYFFPTERNLLLSFWYDYVHFKARRAKATVEDFWDNRVVFLKQEVEDLDNSRKRRQLYRDLLNALHHRRLSKIIIDFLKSSPPEEHYLPVVEAMKRAWRDDGGAAGLEVAPLSEESEDDDPAGDESGLHAKTYFIAAQLHYELSGRQDEFQVISRGMAELTAFVQKQFGVKQLPGTFRKLKGYSYKKALTGRNVAKKGQLRPFFRQIAGHSEVFGEVIAGRAREILAEHFN